MRDNFRFCQCGLSERLPPNQFFPVGDVGTHVCANCTKDLVVKFHKVYDYLNHPPRPDWM
jgi:hypothetical protein